VTEVLAKEGDVVKAGQPLVKLQDDDLQLAVQSDQASLKSAQLKLEQAKQGPKDTDITAAQAKVDSAKAALQALYTGPTHADVADAQSRITSAQASLNKAKAGPTQQDIANAQQKIEQAKNSLWGAQSNRDAICGRVKDGDNDPSCQGARAQVNQQE